MTCSLASLSRGQVHSTRCGTGVTSQCKLVVNLKLAHFTCEPGSISSPVFGPIKLLGVPLMEQAAVGNAVKRGMLSSTALHLAVCRGRMFLAC